MLGSSIRQKPRQRIYTEFRISFYYFSPVIPSSLPHGCCSVTMISGFLRRENRCFLKKHKFLDLILHLYCNLYFGASLVSQTIKNLPAVQETRVRSLGREDRLEKEMATHSSILACKIPWMEEPGRL